MAPTVLGHTGALVYTRRGSCMPCLNGAQGRGAAMKGETTGGKRDSSTSRVKREEYTSATRRSSARTLGQMATVSQRQTQLIPQPKTSRAMAPVEPASRRSLLPIKPQRLSHVWRARALVAVVITVIASVAVGLIQAWQLAPHTS